MAIHGPVSMAFAGPGKFWWVVFWFSFVSISVRLLGPVGCPVCCLISTFLWIPRISFCYCFSFILSWLERVHDFTPPRFKDCSVASPGVHPGELCTGRMHCSLTQLESGASEV